MSEEAKKTTQHDPEHKVDIERHGTHPTHLERDEIRSLSYEHRQYLVAKHGTLDLDPVPSMADVDPYNWPKWKKIANLLLVAFHACMATFTAASIVPAFPTIAEDLNGTIQQVSYLTALQIAIIGVAPLFWRPFSSRYGRRPIFILSLIGSLCFNLGCAKARSYASLATCSAFTSFFICPASAIGSAVVVETFFKNERARYMGVWTLMFTLGVPTAPLIFGFVTTRVGYQWIYWILSMINGLQLVLYLFLGPETRFIRHRDHSEPLPTIQDAYFRLRRIDPRPLTTYEFVAPFRLAKYPCVLVPSVSYSTAFLFASTLIILEIPVLFKAKFGFNAQQLGLQFIGIIIGSMVGELFGGRLSDFWMAAAKARSPRRTVQPEHRLWLSYPGYLFAICGIVVFLVRTEQAPQGQWNVTPIIGAGIASVGKQMITTIVITYAVDCYPEESSSVGVFVCFVRHILGFLGPFWFPQMFDAAGLVGSAGVAVGLIVGVSILPTVLVQIWGGRLRFSMK